MKYFELLNIVIIIVKIQHKKLLLRKRILNRNEIKFHLAEVKYSSLNKIKNLLKKIIIF